MYLQNESLSRRRYYSMDLLHKAMDEFLYDTNFRHGRVKKIFIGIIQMEINKSFKFLNSLYFKQILVAALENLRNYWESIRLPTFVYYYNVTTPPWKKKDTLNRENHCIVLLAFYCTFEIYLKCIINSHRRSHETVTT